MNQAGDAGRAFWEFGLGFNPLLAIPADRPWIPYYGIRRRRCPPLPGR